MANVKDAPIGEIAMILDVPEDVVIQTVVITTPTHMIPKVVPILKSRKIKKDIYRQIIGLFDLKQEDGGILGMRNLVITSFCFDKGNSQKEYQINVNKFTEVVEKWDEQGIEFAGFIHSHTNGENRPSIYDFMYVKKFLKANPDIESLDFPIVYLKDGKVSVQYYIFEQNEFIPVNILEVE